MSGGKIKSGSDKESGMTPAEELREAARLMRERADLVDSMGPHITAVADALRPDAGRALADWLDQAANAYYVGGLGFDNPLAVARAYLAPVLRDAQGDRQT